MDTLNSQERRRLKRHNLSYYMLVLDSNTQQVMGHLLNITPHGLMMDSSQPLPLERTYRLRLDLAPDIADKDHISFLARSKWCRPDKFEPHLYDIGFSITGISVHDAGIIQRISEKYTARKDFDFLS
jgi:hypothetical protein